MVIPVKTKKPILKAGNGKTQLGKYWHTPFEKLVKYY
jgi:hypothetical protein